MKPTGIEPASRRRMPQSLIIAQTALLLGVSRRTVYNRISEGKLRTLRARGSQRVLMESIEALRAEMLAAKESLPATDRDREAVPPHPHPCIR